MRNLFQRNNNERAGQEVDDFSQYKIRMFKAVPPNMALICQNIFTGRPFVKTSGLVILMPWVKSKMVSLADNTIDYPKEKYKTVDGIELTIDLAITFSISDPIKYEFNNNDPMQELKIKTQDMLRQYVALRTVDEMTNGRHTLNDFDPNRDYASFAVNNGLEIKNVYFKNVELPQSMKDDYEKKKVQEMENAKLLAEAQTKKAVSMLEAEARYESAKKDAEANKILGTAANVVQADEIKKILENIVNMNATPAEKLELVKAQLLSKGNGNLFYGMEGQSELMKYLLAKDQNGSNRMQNNGNKQKSGYTRTRKK